MSNAMIESLRLKRKLWQTAGRPLICPDVAELYQDYLDAVIAAAELTGMNAADVAALL